MDKLATTLHITRFEDWQQITVSTIRKHGGHQLLAKYNGSPSKLLASVYPEYPKIVGLVKTVPLHFMDITGQL